MANKDGQIKCKNEIHINYSLKSNDERRRYQASFKEFIFPSDGAFLDINKNLFFKSGYS